MELKLDSEAMGKLASKAIFDEMSEETRNNILKEAVKHLLTPKLERGHGYGKTPLMLAFERGLEIAAFQAVQERIASDPQVKSAIQDMLGIVINAALDAEAANYDTTLANAIGSALANWLHEKVKEG